MKTEKIAVELIVENEYNPNEMDENKFKKLVQNIKRKGFRKPIEVRQAGKKYVIIDGAHRFRACKELGYKEVDCIVDNVDETEAMIDTLNANIHGTHNPYKEAQMFKNIHERYALKDIEKLTIYGQAEIKDRMELLNLSPSIQKELEKQERAEAREAPVILTFMVKEADKDLIIAALNQCENRSDKNRALVELCKKFLNEKKEVPTADE
jgi:ParB family chromosome partitioning protein